MGTESLFRFMPSLAGDQGKLSSKGSLCSPLPPYPPFLVSGQVLLDSTDSLTLVLGSRLTLNSCRFQTASFLLIDTQMTLAPCPLSWIRKLTWLPPRHKSKWYRALTISERKYFFCINLMSVQLNNEENEISKDHFLKIILRSLFHNTAKLAR